jgi:hypothetical protein
MYRAAVPCASDLSVSRRIRQKRGKLARSAGGGSGEAGGEDLHDGEGGV